MPLFCTPLNFAKFLFSEIHPVKKIKLSLPLLYQIARRFARPTAQNGIIVQLKTTYIHRTESKSPHPPPAPVGAGAALWGEHRRPEASPVRRKTLTKVRVDSAVESWYTDNGPTGWTSLSALSRKEQRTARAERCSFLYPCCREATSKRGRPAPEAHPAPGTPSRPRSLAAGRGR